MLILILSVSSMSFSIIFALIYLVANKSIISLEPILIDFAAHYATWLGIEGLTLFIFIIIVNFVFDDDKPMVVIWPPDDSKEFEKAQYAKRKRYYLAVEQIIIAYMCWTIAPVISFILFRGN